MFVNPTVAIRQLDLMEGMRVADFGAGLGIYSKAASQRVGTTGKVYAVEVQKDLLKRLESELKEEGIKNIDCIWGDIEKVGGTKIAESSMNAVIISNVLFQVGDRLGLIDEAKRILKKGGFVLLLDWREPFGGMGPSPHHVVTEQTAKDLFIKRGFTYVKNISSSEHQYGIIFKHE